MLKKKRQTRLLSNVAISVAVLSIIAAMFSTVAVQAQSPIIDLKTAPLQISGFASVSTVKPDEEFILYANLHNQSDKPIQILSVDVEPSQLVVAAPETPEKVDPTATAGLKYRLTLGKDVTKRQEVSLTVHVRYKVSEQEVSEFVNVARVALPAPIGLPMWANILIGVGGTIVGVLGVLGRSIFKPIFQGRTARMKAEDDHRRQLIHKKTERFDDITEAFLVPLWETMDEIHWTSKSVVQLHKEGKPVDQGLTQRSLYACATWRFYDQKHSAKKQLMRLKEPSAEKQLRQVLDKLRQAMLGKGKGLDYTELSILTEALDHGTNPPIPLARFITLVDSNTQLTQIYTRFHAWLADKDNLADIENLVDASTHIVETVESQVQKIFPSWYETQ